MTKEIGTLTELNVKPRDVVECVENEYPNYIGLKLIIRDDGIAVIQSEKYNGCTFHPRFDVEFRRKYRIVSRAATTPKTWEEMTDEEKGALLLAEHREEVIEWKHPQDMYDDWDKENLRFGISYMAYRVRPPEPKRETVAIEGYVVSDDQCVFTHIRGIIGDTHRITFDVIDGTPDCASIRMEELW